MEAPGGTVSVAPLDLAGPWTFEQLHDLPEGVLHEGYRYEVCDGHLVVNPPPGWDHQLLSNGLRDQLAAAAPPEWLALVEPPLPLGTDGRQPDCAVVRRGTAVRPGPYKVGPEGFGLVIEIVSPRTRKTDRFAKPGEYAEAGIPIFWRVEQDPLRLHACTLDGDHYVEVAVVAGVGVVPVPWGELTIDLPAAAAF